MSHHKKTDDQKSKNGPHEEAGNAADLRAVEPAAAPGDSAQPVAADELIAELRKNNDELKNQLLRISADYQNYQKRMQRQIEQDHQITQETLVRGLLSTIDNFEITLGKAGDIQDVKALLAGVQITYDHLMKTVAGFGLKKIVVQPGEAFNHHIHEAIMHEDSPGMAGNCVVRELAGGYMMNDRTLRPAKVSVSKEA